MINKENFRWDQFLQPYELAVEGFILKIEGIKKQYKISETYCPIEIISGRVKSPDSILDKAKRLNVSLDELADKVHDIGGIRITCKYIEDIYQVAELLKARRDVKLIEIRDYVKEPKPSGYRSLHLIMSYNVETLKGQVPVLLEFQIRTHAMHFWASIEHSLKYKYQKQIPLSIKERLKEASSAAAQVDKEMSAIHTLIMELEDNSTREVYDELEKEVSLIDLRKW